VFWRSQRPWEPLPRRTGSLGYSLKWERNAADEVLPPYVHCGYNRFVMSATKTARVNLRVAPADDILLRQAAELLGETLSEFLIESGRERAERVVADRTRFVLDEAAWSAFNEALDRPAEVKPELRDLFARPRPE
jgi:uncharacterized protein (DUF1778 family)